MRVMVVEDVEDQAIWLTGKLRQMYPAAEVTHIRTESEFRTKLEEIRQNPPDLILMDVMLRWADPAPNMPPRPDDVQAAGVQRAGLRCVQLLREDSRSANVEVIIVTVLEDVDFEDGELPTKVSFVTKEGNHQGILEAIEGKLGGPGRAG